MAIGETSRGDAFELIHPDDQDRVRKTFAATVSTGDQLEVEYRHVCADGSSHPMECQGTVIRNGKGDSDSVVLVSRDITDRKAKDVEIEEPCVLRFADQSTQSPTLA
ncbi:MAG: PAS domain-containing protein [Rhodocyclaceae bacterium]|nr:PAS domain-containing protein [Rhodocyclaceae bacterium]